MVVYFNGVYQTKSEVRISPDDRGFLMADGVYEVVAAVRGAWFRLDAHLDRLARSLREIKLHGIEADVLGPVAAELLRRNDLTEAYAKLYIQITRGVAPRRHAFPHERVEPTVYATVSSFEPPEARWAEGVSAITVPDTRWARCDIKSIALLPNVLASQAAAEAGAYEALFVRDGVVTEGSHTSALIVVGGEVLTHPGDPRILPGVTRAWAMEACRDLDIPVREAEVSVGDLPDAGEIMLLGTTSGVMPVVEVDGAPIGNGVPGAVTRALQDAFRAAMGLA
jgi:D-alanine transaminase